MHERSITRRRHFRRPLVLTILGPLALLVLGAASCEGAHDPANPVVGALFIDPTAATLDASAGAGGADFQTFKVTATSGYTGVLTTGINNEAGTPDFDIVTDTCNGKQLYSHYDECDITVAYNNATGTGQGTAELVVSANPGGTVQATLTGNGVA